MKARDFRRVLVTSFFLGLGLTHCSKATVEPKYSSLYTSVFSDCGKCHEPNNQDAYVKVPDLDFSSASAGYTSLIKTSTKSGCTSLKYASAGEPSKSIVMAVLDNTTHDSFQSDTGTSCEIIDALNHGISSYSTEQVTAVKQWIQDGASNN